MRSRVIAGLLLLLLAGCEQGVGCSLVKVAEVPLEARNRLIVVPVTISGRTLNMLLDTGAERSVLDEAAVRRLGIPQDGRTVSVIVGVSGGMPRADANVEGMRIGDVPLAITRMPVSTFSGSMGIDGALGFDVLQDYDLDLDEPDRTLTLYRIRRCEHADPPWSQQAAPVAGVSTRTRRIEIPIEIEGVTGMATVDTGATFTVITPQMTRRLGLTEGSFTGDRSLTLHIVGGADVQARIHRFKTIRIGQVTAHNAAIVVLLSEPQVMSGGRRLFADGLIGQDLLHNHRVWLSFATDRVYMSRGSNEAAVQ
jgi:predicted aspartyl protease